MAEDTHRHSSNMLFYAFRMTHACVSLHLVTQIIIKGEKWRVIKSDLELDRDEIKEEYF